MSRGAMQQLAGVVSGAMQRGDVISKGGTRPPKSPTKPSNLPSAPVDLGREVYLTAAEAARYCRCPTIAAFRQWARREGLPKCHRGRRVLYFRRDLDAALQPLRKPDHRGNS